MKRPSRRARTVVVDVIAAAVVVAVYLVVVTRGDVLHHLAGG